MGDDGTFVKCHRFVLSACSPFFEKVFENFTKRKDSSDDKADLAILLATYKSKNVQRMVDYIYNGILSEYQRNDDDKVCCNLCFFSFCYNLYFRALMKILFV